MSDMADLIAEVRELFNEGWCVCTRDGLGKRVLDALEQQSSLLASARAEGARDARDCISRIHTMVDGEYWSENTWRDSRIRISRAINDYRAAVPLTERPADA